jgi:ferredoxin
MVLYIPKQNLGEKVDKSLQIIEGQAVKVKVDRDLCIGVGNCVACAPTVFELDEENKAVVLDPSSVDDSTLLEAAKSCTENAIIIEDDEGHQLYP